MKTRSYVAQRFLLFASLAALAGGLAAGGLFAARAQAEPLQPVIIVLKAQPQVEITRQVQSVYQPQLEALTAELRLLDRRRIPYEPGSAPLSRVQENALVEQIARAPVDPAVLARMSAAADRLDDLRSQVNQEIRQRAAPLLTESQQPLAGLVQSLGGKVTYRYQALNAIAAQLPAAALPALRENQLVAEVVEDRQSEALLDVSAQAIGANSWWGLGYTGAGVDVAVVDTGIDASHPALDPVNVNGQRCLVTGDDNIYTAPAYTTDPSADDVNGHGTHVGGTVGSTSPTYRGIAYGLSALLNGKAGYDLDGLDGGSATMFDSDAMDCVEWAVNGNLYGAEVVSYSFGSAVFEEDGAYERFWDSVVSGTGTVVTIAAGNGGSGASTIYVPGNAYNIISVGNIQDLGTVDRADDTIRTGSSRGPTVGGRKKPDIVAPGTSIISTNNNWETSDDYVGYTGTSMAAPHVAGSAALLIQRGVTDPLAVKALMINTAEDRSPAGWDSAYGWGYLDLVNLNAHVDDYFLGEINPSPDYRLYAGPVLLGDAASLAWNRRVVYDARDYPSTWYGLTNLDLRSYAEDTNLTAGNSLSAVDNVEQVRFASDLASAVIKVDAVSAAISGAESEPFALATQEGFSLRDGPAPSILGAGQGEINAGGVGEVITVTLQVKNQGDLKAHDLSLDVILSAGLLQVSGPTLPLALPSLAVGETTPLEYTFTFQKTSAGMQMLIMTASSNSYEETFTGAWAYGGYSWSYPVVYR